MTRKTTSHFQKKKRKKEEKRQAGKEEKILNPATSMLLPQLSPTNSSASSSSDLDSQSTGSFFQDRSTTLGTLMGVTFPSITFRAPSQRRDPLSSSAPSPADGDILTRRRRRKPRDDGRTGKRRWRWWSLCCQGGAKSASLGQFLEMERRYGDLEGGAPSPARTLFSEGRVLPPPDVGNVASSSSAGADGSLCRFPVSIAGICCNCGAG